MFTIKSSTDNSFFGTFPTDTAATAVANRIRSILIDVPVAVVPLPDGVTPLPVHTDFLD